VSATTIARPLNKLEHGAWQWSELGDVCRTTSGGTPSRQNPSYFGGPIPWVKSGELPDGLVHSVAESISEEALRDSSAKLLPVGTLLIALYGATVGKLGVLTRAAATNQAVCAIFPSPRVDTKFLFWFLRSRRSALIAQAVGGAQPNISQGVIRSLRIPIPPLGDQRGIVAEIEKQFSRLDEAVAGLQRVKANLRRYEAATLKAALTGQLVPNEADLARTQNRSFESADELLQRVRRSELKAGGDRRGATEPVTDVGELPALPAGWSWAQLSSITTIKGGITVDRKRADLTARPVPYLRVANVQRGHLALGEVKFIDAPAADIDALQLMRGDILFNEGGDRDKLGRGWIWEEQLRECIHQNHVFRARPMSADISPKLISWWGNTFGKDYFQREGKQTTNLASINLSKLSKFPVPVPPLAEQHRIVAEVDRRLSIVREVEAEVDANLKRASSVRSAVLSGFFPVDGLDSISKA
jgi:type I restriction enzyme S subunit